MNEEQVLAVVCDWRIRKLIRANLEAVGLTVWEAVNGPHSLQVVGESRPDLILIDLDAPEVDAADLLRHLDMRFGGTPVPVIVISAEPLDRRLLEHGPVVSCLQKPFSATGLLQQVQEALHRVPDSK